MAGRTGNISGLGAVYIANLDEALTESIENDSNVQQAILDVNKNKGYYATEAALNAAHPTGVNGDWAIVGVTDTVWIWDGDTSAWVDSGIQGSVTSVDGKTGAVDGRYTNAIYIGKGGNDSNDGKSYIQRKLTVASAKTAAAALTPSTTNIIVLRCDDAGIYSESYTSADYINLYMPCAILTGNITVSHNMTIHLDDLRGNITVDSGKVCKTQVLEHSTGSVTNNGTVRGRIGWKLYGISDIEFKA